MAILIGVHGLDNKPVPDILENSWRSALSEGLARHPDLRHEFALVIYYWADIFYETPLELEREPYVRATEDCSPAAGGNPASEVLVDLSIEELATRYPDLLRYFHEPEVGRKTRRRLSRLLQTQDSGKLMLLSHSMGCVIAYDVLVELSPQEFSIEMLTFGCPLGFPQLWKRMQADHGELRVPEVLNSWTNYADSRDPVATAGFHEVFQPNQSGVEICDRVVHNDYRNPSGEVNPHKIYGYLRNPEVAGQIARFLKAPQESDQSLPSAPRKNVSTSE